MDKLTIDTGLAEPQRPHPNRLFQQSSDQVQTYENLASQDNQQSEIAERLDVYITEDNETTNTICHQILESGVVMIGVDAEGLGQNSTRKISLIQIAFNNSVALIKLDNIWNNNKCLCLPESFVKLMRSRKIIKVGVDITNDMEYLRKSYGINGRGIIDLQDLATVYRVPDISMIGLLRKYFPKHSFDRQERLKQTGSIRTGNWDDELTKNQIEYAAIDGYLSFCLGQRMLSTGDNCGAAVVTSPNVFDWDQESDKLYIWLKQWFELGEYRPPNKIINQIVNSYSPLRKTYIETDRHNMAVKLLDVLIEGNRLIRDDRGYLSRC